MAAIAETSTNVPLLLKVNDDGRLKMNAEGQTTIFKYASVSNSTATIYTVTAGKTFYLCLVSLSYTTAANGQTAIIQINTGGGAVTVLNFISKITATYYITDTGTHAMSFATPLPFPTGTVFTVVSSASTLNAFATLMGWEE